MYRLLIVLVIMLFSTRLHATVTDYSNPSEMVLLEYYSGIMDDVNRAQMTVDNVVNEASDPTAVNLTQWLPKLKDAIFQLKVKYALAWDFRGSPALRSPLIRDKLRSVMEKQIIDVTDIEDLQKLVSSEKAQMMIFDEDAKAHAK